MTDVDEVLEDVLHCVPCLQVNGSREVGKRYRALIEARGDYWVPKEVTIGMLKSFKENINFDRLTDYKNDYPSPHIVRAGVDIVEPKGVAMEVEKWRANPDAGFKQRDLRVFALLTSENYENLPMGGVGPCDKYCSPNCPTKEDPEMEHLCELEDLVSVDQIQAFLSYVKADHFEIFIDLGDFSTELVGRLLHDDRIKAAKTLAVYDGEKLYDGDPTLRWGSALTADRAVSYFCSPGNEERALFLEDFMFTRLLVPRVIQEVLAAAETKDFGRMLFVEDDAPALAQCIDHLKSLGHIPLVIENSPKSDMTTVFFFKNRRSGETLSLKFGTQKVTKSDNDNEGLWARFKRLPEAHTIGDLIYDA